MKTNKGFSSLKNEIIDVGLCARCGACVGVCPKNCIDFSTNNDFTPVLTEDICIECGKCNKVCPGKGYNILEKREESFFSDKIGSYKSLYTGFSTNDTILNNCASGGIITSLLVHLFQKGTIDFAVVVTNLVNADNGYAKGIIAKCVDDVLMASQSKYANVATLNLVKEIRKNAELKRGVIVGVPCQLAAVNNITMLDKVFAEKIAYKIGLFCGYTYTSDCYDYLFRYMGTISSDVQSVEGWRCDGVPGNFKVKTSKGHKAISFQEEHSLDTILFAQNRCMLCEDCFAEYCDIAVGDVGHNKYRDSLIIARTTNGESLLFEAQKSKSIELSERTYQYLLDKTIVNFMVREKREKVEIRKKIYERKGLKTTDWPYKSKEHSLASLIVVRIQYLARKEKVRSFILKNSKRHYQICKTLYLGLENSILIRGIRKIERCIKHEK